LGLRGRLSGQVSRFLGIDTQGTPSRAERRQAARDRERWGGSGWGEADRLVAPNRPAGRNEPWPCNSGASLISDVIRALRDRKRKRS
jgi:hypothetical protein